MHSLLRRQLRRHLHGVEIPAELTELLNSIDQAYEEFDDDRLMMERSLELSSRELLQANSEMRALFQALPDLFFRLDASGRILDCKGGRAGEFALEPASLIGRRIQDIPVASAAEAFQAGIDRLQSTGEPQSVEYALPLGEQNAVFEARLVLTLGDEIVVVARNITERKKVEDRLQRRTDQILKKQAALQQLALSAKPNLPTALDEITMVAAKTLDVERVGIWVYADERTAMICEHMCIGGGTRDGAEPSGGGGTRDGAAGRLEAAQFPEYFSALESSRAIAADDALEDPRTRELGPAYLRPNGISSILNVPIWVDGRVAGIICHEHTGEPRHWSIEEQDVATSIADFVSLALQASRRNQLEAQLRQSQKMEAIGLLAGGVAHDFNNLLNVILGYADLARSKLPPEHRAATYLARVREATGRAADLTNKLLTFSRKDILKVEPIDLNEVLRDFSRLLDRIVGADVEVVVQTAPEPLVVDADRPQIDQLLLNLCTNARQAMPAGGRLSIGLGRRRLGAEEAKSRGLAEGVEFAEILVSDTGVGMDEEVISRLWEPFFTTKDSGTGLGLAVVYGVVEQHHGFITVDSELGRGSTFQIHLPPSTKLSRQGGAADAAPDVRGGETVLVAEDEVMLRELIVQALSDLGYHVLAAENGDKAVQMFHDRDDVDLVVLDVVMPVMGGPEAYELMRSKRPDLKAVFASGYAPNGPVLTSLLESENAAFLPKPFVIEHLAAKVRALLGRNGVGRRAPVGSGTSESP
jgi:signal transduction histidine kinase/PAS domain-containing protein/ActR/RegA family two-component response regulator